MEKYSMSSQENMVIPSHEIAPVQELSSLQVHQRLLGQATAVVILLGGKAGRLGECVVGTAFLEGTLLALRALQQEGMPIHVLIDKESLDIFNEENYQQVYWPEISIQAMYSPLDVTALASTLPLAKLGKKILVLDFHGAHDGLPVLSHEELAECSFTLVGHLFRMGLRNYAHRGPERRYADFICDLFALPYATLAGSAVQPRLRLSIAEKHRYQQLIASCDLSPETVSIMCFFQSVVPAKCYELWDEVMQLLCQYFADAFPGQHLDFLVACGPDKALPDGFKRADIAEWLEDFTGVQHNARVHIYSTASLRDLAILTSHANLVLSNDTGPGHIAGALAIPTIVPFLPGTIYARPIWSSTLYHHGITLEPNPYSYQQIAAAITWGKTDIIDSISPKAIYHTILQQLPKPFQSTKA